jgi:hypothetical protein
MAKEEDIRDLVSICNGQQSLIDGLIAAVSDLAAGEKLAHDITPVELLSRGKHIQIRINEMKRRVGLE